jgi:hypothetical protein
MGKTAFKGPVYGAKGLLAKYSAGAVTSTGASSALACSWIVPVYEDWFICEVSAYCSTASSGGNTITVKSEGGSTIAAMRDWADGNNSTKAQTVVTATWGTSTTGPLLAAATATAGEYEGKWVPGGSTIRLVLSSIANPIANLNVSLRGYTRFINSTRSEG